MDIEKNLGQALAEMGTTLDDATNAQIFCALLRTVRDLQTGMPPAAGDRKLYYFSAEFLVGRLLRRGERGRGRWRPARRDGR